MISKKLFGVVFAAREWFFPLFYFSAKLYFLNWIRRKVFSSLWFFMPPSCKKSFWLNIHNRNITFAKKNSWFFHAWMTKCIQKTYGYFFLLCNFHFAIKFSPEKSLIFFGKLQNWEDIFFVNTLASSFCEITKSGLKFFIATKNLWLYGRGGGFPGNSK